MKATIVCEKCGKIYAGEVCPNCGTFNEENEKLRHERIRYEKEQNKNDMLDIIHKDYDFKCRIIDQVTDIKDFGKLLKLFNYKDKNIFDKQLIQKLREKYKNLMATFKAETCRSFVEDISFFIYLSN